MLGPLGGGFCWILRITLQAKDYYSHFTDKETELSSQVLRPVVWRQLPRCLQCPSRRSLLGPCCQGFTLQFPHSLPRPQSCYQTTLHEACSHSDPGFPSLRLPPQPSPAPRVLLFPPLSPIKYPPASLLLSQNILPLSTGLLLAPTSHQGLRAQETLPRVQDAQGGEGREAALAWPLPFCVPLLPHPSAAPKAR